MRRYQLRVDERGFSGIIEDIVYAVMHAEPRLSRLAVADMARIVLSGRAHQTERCGAHADCDTVGAPVFPLAAVHRTECLCGLVDPDAVDLPRIFAAAVAGGQMSRERRVAAAFQRAIAPFLYECSACGVSPSCNGVPTDPTRR